MAVKKPLSHKKELLKIKYIVLILKKITINGLGSEIKSLPDGKCISPKQINMLLL